MQRTSKPFSIFLIVLLVFSVSFIFIPFAHAQETFGKTDIGGTANNFMGYGPRDEKVACKFTLAEDGDVSSITMYIDGYSGGSAGALVFGVFSDNAGAPNTLLGETEIGDIPATPAWVELSFSPALELSAGVYWLAALVDDTRCSYWYDTGDADQFASQYPDDFADGFSDPFGTPSFTSNREVSIYATYTPSGGGVDYAIDLSLSLGETYSIGQIQWQAQNPISWQTPETYTTQEQWNTSNTLTMSTSETYTLAPQTNYHQDFTWQSTTSYTTIWQTLFNIITSWAHAETFSTLSQTIYNLAVSFSQSFSWLTEVTQSIAGIAYVIDLAWASASTWLLSIQSNFNSAIAWVTSATYTILTQNIFNLVTSLTQGFAWLTDVYIVPAAVAYAVDLVWATSQTWTITLIQGLQYFVDLALTTPLQWLTDIGLSAGLSGTDAVGIAIAFSMITIVICIGLVFGIKKKK